MKKNQIAAMATVLALGALFAAHPSFSQTKPATTAASAKPADNMQIFRDKLRADKKLLVSEMMQFTDPEAKAFWPVYDLYQAESTKINDRMIKLIGEYAGQYKAKTMTNEFAKKLVDDYLLIEGDRQKLRQTYLPKFRMALSEMKVARFYQLENKIQAAVDYELADAIPMVP